MNVLVQKSWRITAVLAIAMFMFVTTGASAHGTNKNPGVFPINAHIHGLTYNEWSARWWQFALQQNTLDICATDKPGSKVIFLAGTPGPP